MQPQRTTWYVQPSYTWAGGGYFGATPPDSMESLGTLVTRIGAVLHRQGARAGVLMLDAKAARITGMSDPMDGQRHRALDSAAAAGWQSGRLGPWTTIHHPDRPTVYVGQLDRLEAAAREDERHWPFGLKLGYPADLVAAVQGWHDLTGVAWQAGAAVMGVELIRNTLTPYRVPGRDGGKAEQRQPTLRDDSTPELARVSMWSPQMWHQSTADTPGRWVHGYDKRRAGITAAGVAKCSPARLKRGRRPFDARRAGWWLVSVPPWNMPNMPHPMGPHAADHRGRLSPVDQRMWVPTATMDLAVELHAEGVFDLPEVFDSFTGPARPVLKPFQELVEQAYQAPPGGDYDTIAQAAVRDVLKLAGNAGLGLVGKVLHGADDPVPSIWRRDWYAAVNAVKQANAWRRAWGIGKAEHRWPVAFEDDKVFYASDEPDAEKAAPAGFGDLQKDAAGCYRAESTVERKRRRKA